METAFIMRCSAMRKEYVITLCFLQYNTYDSCSASDGCDSDEDVDEFVENGQDQQLVLS